VIAHLRGLILSKAPSAVVVECGGVGYELAISVATYTELGELGAEARLHVHTHVREDALLLFGFAELAEKRLFEKLLTISGIGPKLAITVLSGISAERLVGAIRAGDHATLTKIPGIGKKTAERVVLELKDKLDDMARFATESGSPVSNAPGSPRAVQEDVISALINLGYSRSMSEKAVEAATRDAASKGGYTTMTNFEWLFRAAMAVVR
jgi:Holliday junction DNA helicase RuvA